MAHSCNPSYSGGRDQEYQNSKPAQANRSRDPILKKPFTKKGWWSAQSVGRVQALVLQKQKKKKKRRRRRRREMWI
jgi:hypothetical protein